MSLKSYNIHHAKLNPYFYHWEDLRFPASTGVKITGKEPGQEASGLLLFDADRVETVAYLAQLPHSWLEESEIEMHVHWQKTTSEAGNVYWQVQYKKSPMNEVMDANFTTLFETAPLSATPDIDTAGHHMLTEPGHVDMTGMGISDCIVLLVSRVGDNDLDTYGDDARMLEFDIHYQRDAPGSIQEYVK